MNYLSGPIAEGLGRFRHGLNLSDAYLLRQAHSAMALLGAALVGFTRGRMHGHFLARSAAMRRLQ